MSNDSRHLCVSWLQTLTLVLLVLVVGTPALQADAIDFETQIRPLLTKQCAACHGAKQQKSGLRIDARSFFFKGGDAGQIVDPGNPDASELIRRVRSTNSDERMPPEGSPLASEEIALLEQWIREGANWPETEADRLATIDPRRSHWSWQPLKVQLPPKHSGEDGRVTDTKQVIDQWILDKLRAQGLRPSDKADRRTLIRRLSFNLHGLPPAPEDVRAFEHDPSPDAWEKLVDRFLESPHYGERQARHWLDIAHYADTHGFERDQRRDNAWRYRDWVIRSFNTNYPYDQFLQDQIAGDVLRPADSAAVIATGFLAAGPWDFVGQAETPSPVLKRLARADDLDDMVTQVMTATCGVTINCARCHDHKLDPISQEEYYSMWAVFAGVRRGERLVSADEEKALDQRRASLTEQLNQSVAALAALRGDGVSLADIVCGGEGFRTGNRNRGIDPVTGQSFEEKRGFLEGAAANRFVRSNVRFVDGVFIPNGQSGPVTVTSSGLTIDGLPTTSGKAWDAVRSGPVNSHFSTSLAGVDYATEPHELLSLHANAGITFNIRAIREHHQLKNVHLSGLAGYFGQTPKHAADIHIAVDGKIVFQKQKIGRDDGLIDIHIAIPAEAEFLTLIATDGGNDIGHDQICFADLFVVSSKDQKPEGQDSNDSDVDSQQTEIEQLTRSIETLRREIEELPAPARVYAVVTEAPPEIKVQLRGNPEQPGQTVSPGVISCVAGLPSPLGTNEMSESERRTAFARWLTHPDNPLPRRVIVNRIWQQHFGTGIVDTPSDFGLGGSLPTHPELLDWLADQLSSNGWSLKHIHRLICLSETWQQTSVISSDEMPSAETPVAADDTSHVKASNVDASNRLLWRQNPKRLDAESLRDSLLAVSGCLNLEMYGPGYRDFEYKEEYAPVYTYITADTPELWKRSIYRFVVRTTPDQFLTTLDCPNPGESDANSKRHDDCSAVTGNAQQSIRDSPGGSFCSATAK